MPVCDWDRSSSERSSTGFGFCFHNSGTDLLTAILVSGIAVTSYRSQIFVSVAADSALPIDPGRLLALITSDLRKTCAKKKN